VRVDVTDHDGRHLDSILIEEERTSVALWRVSENLKEMLTRYRGRCYVFNHWLTGGPCSPLMTPPG
jgi:hypothetical protein